MNTSVLEFLRSFETSTHVQASAFDTTVSMDTLSAPEVLRDREERSQQYMNTAREERLRRRRERERDHRRSEIADQKDIASFVTSLP